MKKLSNLELLKEFLKFANQQEEPFNRRKYLADLIDHLADKRTKKELTKLIQLLTDDDLISLGKS
jgi:hypothetical protein